METIVEWCNSLSRSLERAKQRSQEIGYEGAEYDDLLMLRATLACRIGELREQISEYCAPWFEVAR